MLTSIQHEPSIKNQQNKSTGATSSNADRDSEPRGEASNKEDEASDCRITAHEPLEATQHTMEMMR